MGIKQPKTSAGTKTGAFKVNNPVGKATSGTSNDTSNSFPGRKNTDVAFASGLRGHESQVAYGKGRSYGK